MTGSLKTLIGTTGRTMVKHYTCYYQEFLDPIAKILENSKNVLLFSKSVPLANIRPMFTLQELCDKANDQICWNGIESFIRQDHTKPNFDTSQFVKINCLYQDFLLEGNKKPFLLTFDNDLTTVTGDTRMRALELVSSITSVSAFISINKDSRSLINNAQPITTFKKFADCCDVPFGTPFFFTESNGYLEWYEVHAETKIPCAGQTFREFCQQAIYHYLLKQPSNFKFTVDWFKQSINWQDYTNE